MSVSFNTCEFIGSLLKKDYTSTSLWKELAQNADDAGARIMKICFDRRKHPTTDLLSPELECYQGEAMMVYNDSVFTDSDRQAIYNIASSSKKGNVKKTGRFGLGFNSVYHITELPSFVSGDHISYIDLTGVLKSNGKINASESLDIVKSHPNQFKPYDVFGCKIHEGKSFQGTLFRLPIRFKGAPISKLGVPPCDASSIEAIFTHFDEQNLIFLKFLEEVEFYEIPKDCPTGTPILKKKVSMKGVSEKQRTERAFQLQVPEFNDPMRRQKLLKIKMSTEININDTKWMLQQSTGSGPSIDLSSELAKTDSSVKVLPWGGVACKMPQKDGIIPILSGRASCFLPLPKDTGLPVHVNGFFEVPTSRSEIFWNTNEDGQAAKFYQWNKSLLCDPIADSYVQLLKNLVEKPEHNEDFIYSLFPPKNAQTPWDVLSTEVSSRLKSENILWCGDKHKWKRPDQVYITSKTFSTRITDCLAELNTIIARLPNNVLSRMEEHSTSLTLDSIIQLLRDIIKSDPKKLLSLSDSNKCELLVYIIHQLLGDQEVDNIDYDMKDKVPYCVLRALIPVLENTVNVEEWMTSESKILLNPSKVVVSILRNANTSSIKSLNWISCWDHIGNHPNLATALGSELFSKQYDICELSAEWLADVLITICLETNINNKWLSSYWSLIASLHSDEDFSEILLKVMNERSESSVAVIPSVGSLPPIDFTTEVLPIKNIVTSSSLTDSLSSVLSAIEVSTTSLSNNIVCSSDVLSKRIFIGNAGEILDALLERIESMKKLSENDCTVVAGFIKKNHRDIDPTVLLKAISLPIWGTDFSVVQQKHGIETFVLFPTSVDNYTTVNIIAIQQREELCLVNDKHIMVIKPIFRDIMATAGIPTLKEHTFWKSWITDRINDIRKTSSTEEYLTVVEELLQQSNSNTDVASVVSGCCCIPSLDETVFVKPIESLDPYSEEITMMGDSGTLLKSLIVSPEFINRKRSIKHWLLGCGMQSTISSKTLREIVLADVMKVGNVDQARRLFHYVNRNFDKVFPSKRKLGMFERFKTAFSKLNEAPEDEQHLARDIQQLPWLPIQSSTLQLRDPLLPIVSSDNCLMSATTVRPFEDRQLCSSSHGILESELVPCSELRTLLGWDELLTCTVVANQLLAISKLIHGRDRQEVENSSIGLTISAIYGRLVALHQSDKKQFMTEVSPLLTDQCVIWDAGASTFYEPSTVAITLTSSITRRVFDKSEKNGAFLPGMHSLPNYREPEIEMFLSLGLNETFSPDCYVEAIERMSVKEEPLTDEVLRSVVSVLMALSENTRSINPQITVYLPDNNRILRPATSLLVNDYDDKPLPTHSPELRNRYFIHGHVSKELATAFKVACRRKEKVETFTKAYGQKQELTATISKIIKNSLSEVRMILLELIQNADDAGASSLTFAIDSSTYGKHSLFSESMSSWQGPALLVHNNAKFTDEDFHNLAAVGGAHKLDSAVKTGRFGIGFCGVYKITDLPSIVSGDKLVILDPHRKYLYGTTSDKPGLIMSFPDPAVEDDEFKDQFSPYMHFGCDFRKPYEGTLLRIPFRSEELAKNSKISNQHYTTELATQHLEELCQELPGSLPFLKHVRKIEVIRKHDDTNTDVFKVELSISESQEKKRKQLYQFVAGNTDGREGFKERLQQTSDSQLPKAITEVEVSYHRSSDNSSCKDKWILSDVIGGGEAKRLALEGNNERRHIPWGGVALLRSRTGVGLLADEPFVGSAHSLLPVRQKTNTAFHINAAFELKENRSALWYDENKELGDWNTAVLRDVCVPAAIELLLRVRDEGNRTAEQFYELFPRNLVGIWEHFATGFYQNISDNDHAFFITSSDNKTQAWVSPSKARFADSDTPEVVSEVLLALGDKVVHPHSDILNNLKKVSKITIITKSVVRDALSLHNNVLLHTPGTDHKKLDLLEFILPDSKCDDFEKELSQLHGISLIPLHEGGFGTFSSAEDCENNFLFYTMDTNIITPGCQHRFVRTSYESDKLNSVFSTKGNYLNSLCRTTNLRILKREHLESLIVSGMLSLDFIKKNEISKAEINNESTPSLEWIISFWKLQGNEIPLSDALRSVPLIPASYKFVSAESKVLRSVRLTSQCIGLIPKLGINLVLETPLHSEDSTVTVFPIWLPEVTAASVLETLSDFDTIPSNSEEDLLHFIQQSKDTLIKEQHSKILKKLPIFKCYQCDDYISVGDGKERFIPPQDQLNKSNNSPSLKLLFNDRFFNSSDSVNIFLRDWLDIKQLDYRCYLAEYLLPDTDCDPVLKADYVVALLSQFQKPEKVPSTLIESLRQNRWVYSPVETKPRQCSEFFNWDISKSLGNLDRSLFPDEKFLRVGIFLDFFGMKKTLNAITTVKVVTSLNTDNSDSALQSWQALFTQLSKADLTDEEETCLKGSAIIPVIDEENPTKVVFKKPSQTRPRDEASLCSFTYSIAACDIPEKFIKLWYEKPVESSALVKQLCDLSEKNTNIGIEAIYKEMSKRLLSGEETADMVAEINRKEDRKLVWIGGTKFVNSKRVSLSIPDVDIEPYLTHIPDEHLGSWVDGIWIPLCKRFNIKNSFENQDYCNIVTEIADKYRGIPLPQSDLSIAVSIAKYISRSSENGITHLPDTDGYLRPINTLVYNDMITSSEGSQNFVSNLITISEAQALGVTSHKSSKQKAIEHDIVDKIIIKKIEDQLINKDDHLQYIVHDLIEFSIKAMAKQTHFIIDTAPQCGNMAAVLPGSEDYILSDSLLLHIDSVVSDNMIVNSLKNGTLSGRSLLSGFVISDCVQVVTQDSLLLFSKEGCKKSNLREVNKSFSTQIEAFRGLHQSGTTVRFPIRKQTSISTLESLLLSNMQKLHFQLPMLPYVKQVVLSKYIESDSDQRIQKNNLMTICVDSQGDVKGVITDKRVQFWETATEKKSTLTWPVRIMSTRGTSTNLLFPVNVLVTEQMKSGEDCNHSYKFLTSLSSGEGDGSHEVKIGGVCALLELDNTSPQKEHLVMQGGHCTPHPKPGIITGLPVQILSMNITERGHSCPLDERDRWNKSVIKNTWNAYANLLDEIKKDEYTPKNSTSEYNHCYSYWPDKDIHTDYDVREVYNRLVNKSVYLVSGKRSEFKTISEARFNTADLNTATVREISKKLQKPIFDMPWTISKQVVEASEKRKISLLEPERVRELCKSSNSKASIASTLQSSDAASKLLGFATSDLKPTEEDASKLDGALLLPVGEDPVCIRYFSKAENSSSSAVIVGTSRDSLLVPTLSDRFINSSVISEKTNPHLSTLLRSRDFQEKLGLKKINGRFIHEHLQQQDLPTDDNLRIWVDSFWKTMEPDDDVLQLYNDWNILPLESGELVSPKYLSSAFYFSDDVEDDSLVEEQKPEKGGWFNAVWSLTDTGKRTKHEDSINRPDPNDIKSTIENMGIKILAKDFTGGCRFQPNGTKLQVVLKKLSSATKEEEVIWDNVSTEDKQTILNYIGSSDTTYLQATDVKMLKGLPLFTRLSDKKFTDLSTAVMHIFVGEIFQYPNPFFMGDGDVICWIQKDDNHTNLVSKLVETSDNIKQLTEIEALEKLLSPERWKVLAENEQYERLTYIRDNYENIEGGELTRILKTGKLRDFQQTEYN